MELAQQESIQASPFSPNPAVPTGGSPNPLPPAPAPPAPAFMVTDNAFALPTPDVEGLAVNYWKGYRLGMASRGIVPSPEGIQPDQYGNGLQPYLVQRVRPLYRQSTSMGFPLPTNDGYNDAIECAGIYQYENNPKSPKFVSS
jgi:hypothetical protein